MPLAHSRDETQLNFDLGYGYPVENRQTFTDQQTFTQEQPHFPEEEEEEERLYSFNNITGG